MIKIEYKKDIEFRHKEYFKEYVIRKINEIPNEYFDSSSYVNSPSSIMKIDRFNISFKRESKKFLNFIKYNWKYIATGKLITLQRIEEHICKHYPTVKLMIISDIKIKKSILDRNTTIKSTFKDYIYSIFGFTDFTTRKFYDYVKAMAISNLEVKQYCSSVYDEMYKILKRNFPKKINDINRHFPLEDGILESECKIRFEKLYNLDLTLLNFRGLDQSDILNFNFNGEWNPYQLILLSDIKVCPYCNKHYITPIFSQRGRMRADLDHFLPKSKYPYFSMSLYNLIPSCKTCNQSSKKSVDFTFDSINPFTHNINDYFEFRANISTEEIELKIIKDDLSIRKYLEVFKIESSYNYHQNHVQELIHKRLAYPDKYIKKLYDEVPYKPDNIELFKQLIIGYIDSENEINTEVLSKLRRDLAKQFGFIGSANNELINRLKSLRK